MVVIVINYAKLSDEDAVHYSIVMVVNRVNEEGNNITMMVVVMIVMVVLGM